METVITQDLKTRLQENLAARKAQGEEGTAAAQPTGNQPRKRGRPRKDTNAAGLVTPEGERETPQVLGNIPTEANPVFTFAWITLFKIWSNRADDGKPCPAIELTPDEAQNLGLATTQVSSLLMPSMKPEHIVYGNAALTLGAVLLVRFGIIAEMKKQKEEAAKKAQASEGQTSTQTPTPTQGAAQ